jgi:heterodisulfide reductase subunit B2
MRNDEEKRDTINLFMDEEEDYHGEVEVIHLLSYLKDEIGWEEVKEKIKNPLKGMNIAPYYGCTLQRPREVGIEPPGRFELMSGFINALGATAVPMQESDLCCGSYQILGHPDAAKDAVSAILEGSRKAGANALAMSCPLCEFNIGKKQDGPAFYFTQLFALALGIDRETCHLELNNSASIELLKHKGIIN